MPITKPLRYNAKNIEIFVRYLIVCAPRPVNNHGRWMHYYYYNRLHLTTYIMKMREVAPMPSVSMLYASQLLKTK